MTLPSYQMLAVIFSVLSSYAIFADAKDHTIGIKIGLDKRAGPGLQEGIPFVNLVGKDFNVTAQLSERPMTLVKGNDYEFEGIVPFPVDDIQSVDVKVDFYSPDGDGYRAQVFVSKIEIIPKDIPANLQEDKKRIWQGLPHCIMRDSPIVWTNFWLRSVKQVRAEEEDNDERDDEPNEKKKDKKDKKGKSKKDKTAKLEARREKLRIELAELNSRLG